MDFRSTTVKLLIGYYFLIAVVAFWYIHADEHFQIFEFASYKIGNTPLDALPWEFNSEIRSSILPFLAFLLIKGFSIIGIQNPFIVQAFSRVISTALFLFSLYRLAPYFFEQLNINSDTKKLTLFTLSFWLMPTLMTRFNSESLSASFFWIGFSLFDYRKTIEPNKLIIISVGILMGFSFFFRFQSAFLIFILFVWCLIYLRSRIYDWFFIALGALIPFAIEILTNKWLYGHFVLTPYKYFEQFFFNPVHISFGTEPFYYYFQYVFLFFFPPIGAFILIGIFLYCLKSKKSVFTFLLIGFIAIHTLVGHKQIRFITPVFSVLVPMAFIGFTYGFKNRRIIDASYTIVIILNMILLPTALIVKSTRSLNFFVLYFDSKREDTIYTDYLNPFSINRDFPNVKHYYLKRKNLTIVETSKDSLSIGRNYFITRHYYGEDFSVRNVKYMKTYQTLPSFVVQKIPAYLEDGIGVMYIYKAKIN